MTTPPPGDADADPTRRERRPGWVGWAVAVAVAAGVVGFVLWGADRPADPYLADASATTAPVDPSATDPPGASPSGRVPVGTFGETGAVLIGSDGTRSELCLLVAEDREERAQGLMAVEDLGDYDGMLFTFEDDSTSAFWMRNTPMPLTVAYFDADGGFVSSADMEPCGDRADCPLYAPEAPYRYALEVPTARAGDLGVVPGAVLETGQACAPPG